jgi:general secretion pathway protein D
LALPAIAICLLAGEARGDRERDARPNARVLPTQRSSAPAPSDKHGPSQPVAAAAPDAPDFNTCHKIPPNKARVQVNLKPDTDVNHLIAWLAAMTCKSFVYAEETTSHNRNVTIVIPASITPAQAFQLVLGSLDSVGLTLQPAGGFYQIIESMRAKTKSIPVYDYDGEQVSNRQPHGRD